jgi:hypothetical protein
MMLSAYIVIVVGTAFILMVAGVKLTLHALFNGKGNKFLTWWLGLFLTEISD